MWFGAVAPECSCKNEMCSGLLICGRYGLGARGGTGVGWGGGVPDMHLEGRVPLLHFDIPDRRGVVHGTWQSNRISRLVVLNGSFIAG